MQIWTPSCPAEQWAPRSAQSRCQQRLASRFWNPCRPQAHTAREGALPQGSLILGAVRSGWPSACHQGKGEGVEDAPEWVGGAATRPRGGRDTRRGHTQAQASLLRYCPMSLDSLYPPLPRKRRAALAASGPVFSLMGRHETLLHVGFCLKTASRGHCHWLRRTDPVGSTIARPGWSPPGTLGPPWGWSASCAQITGCDELSAGATRAAKSPLKQESGDAPHGGGKTALPGVGGGGDLSRGSAHVHPRCPRGLPRADGADKRGLTSRWASRDRTLEHWRLPPSTNRSPPCSSEPACQHLGGRGRRGLPPVSGGPPFAILAESS